MKAAFRIAKMMKVRHLMFAAQVSECPVDLSLQVLLPNEMGANFTTAKTAIQFHADAIDCIFDRILVVANSDG